MLRKKYQNAGYWVQPPLEGRFRDLKPELRDAIDAVSDVYGGRDLLTYTAIAESTGGWNPRAGQNYMQIMKPGFDAIKDIKSHPKSKKKLQQVKDRFGIDFNNMTLEQVRSNPLANVLAARLYYMLDPTAAPTSVEGIGRYWSDYYNTAADVHGTPDYFMNAMRQFNYRRNPNMPDSRVGPRQSTGVFQGGGLRNDPLIDPTFKMWFGKNASREDVMRASADPEKLKELFLTDIGMQELPVFSNELNPYDTKVDKSKRPAYISYDIINQKQSGGMYMTNPSLYQRMQQLPGGVMQPIPGSDAVEFIGQTHDQGGILMDEQTEVEDGETMDKVTMKTGGEKDYFFSSHLKKGGVSFADMHKQILANGGDQEQINYLAKMQEKAAGRSPNKVQSAKSGGVMKYENGGIGNPTMPNRLHYPLDPDQKSEGKINPSTAGVSWNEAIAEYRAIVEGLGNTLENPIIGTPKEKNALEGRYYQSEKNGNLYQVVNGKYKEIKDDTPKTTIGLRKDYDKAHEMNKEYGDGYTICLSGNCEDGEGVMNTYWTPNADEQYPLGLQPGHSLTDQNKDYVIGQYTGQFKDGRPVGNGEFIFNDLNQADEQGLDFVPWNFTYRGNFGSRGGDIILTNGEKIYGSTTSTSNNKNYGIGTTYTGVFKNNDLYNGQVIKGAGTEDSQIINFENGQEIGDYFSIDVENELVDKGLIDRPEFKYSEGDIDPTYSAMKKYGSYIQPTEEELNTRGYSSFDEFRADYERFHRSQYDPLSGKYKPYNWDNVTQWGPQHQDAWDQLIGGIDQGFVSTGSHADPIPMIDENNNGISDLIERPDKPFIGPLLEDGSIGTDPNEEIEQLPWWKRSITGDRGADAALGVGTLANLAPAVYALTHQQKKPKTLPFESGVTAPIVPKRLRAQKLNHINLNQAYSKNAADFNAMNTYIDQSGGGSANLINRMALWGKKHKGDMEILKAEKDYNTQIENQNIAIANQTELYNVRQEQDAMTQNMQIQAEEAKRLQDVNAFNTAAMNKWQDDQEYMKYAGIISAAQGIGQLTRDVLGYKGDTLRAQGYSIDNTTNRMFLRRHLGGTLLNQDGSIFCENCTNEDIANYANIYGIGQSRYYPG